MMGMSLLGEIMESGNKMTIFITDWFDVNDINHLTAYEHLDNHGTWPDSFIPDYVVMTRNWQLELLSKLASAWVRKMLSK